MKNILLIVVGLCLALYSVADAGTPYEERLADAIYRAEGGANTRHPYGIMKRYKTTTPRQACINTIRSNRRRWERSGGYGSFIDYLADVYCPFTADPIGNINWKRNVRKLMGE